jgi:hypothetical protein
MRDEFQDESEREPLDTPPRRTPDAADTGAAWWWMWIFLFALFLFAGWGFWRAPERVVSTTPAVKTTNDQDRLRAVVGENISRNGHALRAEGAHAFVLSDGNLLGSENVLVITRQSIVAGQAMEPSEAQSEAQSDRSGAKLDPDKEQPLNISADGKARYKVQGKVELFNKDTLEKEIGAKLDDLDAAQYEGKPVIVADSVKAVEEAR